MRVEFLLNLVLTCFLSLALSAASAAATLEDELQAISSQVIEAYNKGDYIRARDLLQQAADLSTKNFGPEHPDTLIIYNNLAFAYIELGVYARARDQFEQVLRVEERILGSEHPDTLIDRYNLAGVHSRLGDYAKAKELFEQTLKVQERVLGAEQPPGERAGSASATLDRKVLCPPLLLGTVHFNGQLEMTVLQSFKCWGGSFVHTRSWRMQISVHPPFAEAHLNYRASLQSLRC